MYPLDPSPALVDPFRRPANKLRDHHQPGDVRFTWNARGALFQLFTSLPRRRGTTVLVPAYHCITLVQPILSAGFEVDCYRVRPDFTIDLEDLASRMNGDVAAVVVIHYFGFPTDLDRVLPLVRGHGARLIEDCSHSFLTREHGRSLGQRGDYAVFSYYKCAPCVIGGALVANAGLPLPKDEPAGAPWPMQLAVIRHWLKQVDARAPTRPMRVVDRVLGSLVSRGLVRHARRHVSDAGAETRRLPPGFLRKPYFFDVSLAQAGLPAYVQRIVEASSWDEIVIARRRNYAALVRMIPDSTLFRRPLTRLPTGVAPYMFPLLLENRRQHEQPLRTAGIPFLRFGVPLHPVIERASDAARADAEYLSARLMLLPIHQDLDEDHVRAYAGGLLDYVELATRSQHHDNAPSRSA